jgi:hypothetical protein
MYYTMPRPIFPLMEDSTSKCVTQNNGKQKQKANVIESSTKLKKKKKNISSLNDSPNSIRANTSKIVRWVAHASDTGGGKYIQYFWRKI